jgi:hypothetical protein
MMKNIFVLVKQRQRTQDINILKYDLEYLVNYTKVTVSSLEKQSGNPMEADPLIRVSGNYSK